MAEQQRAQTPIETMVSLMLHSEREANETPEEEEKEALTEGEATDCDDVDPLLIGVKQKWTITGRERVSVAGSSPPAGSIFSPPSVSSSRYSLLSGGVSPPVITPVVKNLFTPPTQTFPPWRGKQSPSSPPLSPGVPGVGPPLSSAPPSPPSASMSTSGAKSDESVLEIWKNEIAALLERAEEIEAAPIYKFLTAVSIECGQPLENLLEERRVPYRHMEAPQLLRLLASGSSSHQAEYEKLQTMAHSPFAIFMGDPQAQQWLSRQFELINASDAMSVQTSADIILNPTVVGAVDSVMAQLGRTGDEANDIIQKGGIVATLLGNAVGIKIKMSGAVVRARTFRRAYKSSTSYEIREMSRNQRVHLRDSLNILLMKLRTRLGVEPSSSTPSFRTSAAANKYKILRGIL